MAETDDNIGVEADELTDRACDAAFATFPLGPGHRIAALAVLVVYYDNEENAFGFRLRRTELDLKALDGGEDPTVAEIDVGIASALRQAADLVESEHPAG